MAAGAFDNQQLTTGLKHDGTSSSNHPIKP
jgi:hypothetical protein